MRARAAALVISIALLGCGGSGSPTEPKSVAATPTATSTPTPASPVLVRGDVIEYHGGTSSTLVLGSSANFGPGLDVQCPSGTWSIPLRPGLITAWATAPGYCASPTNFTVADGKDFVHIPIHRPPC